MSIPISKQPVLHIDDADINQRMVSRRDAITRGAALSTAAAAGLRLASIPVALAAVASDVFGQGRLPAIVNGVLNFALVLEYLENEFYVRGLAAPSLIPAADRTIFQTISGHETGHVGFLVRTLGAAARPKPTFDYSAGSGSGAGPYADVFTNYDTFLKVSQAFEDTGVRAFKGQAPVLMAYKPILTAALTIHSVEARHASEVRRLRGNFVDTEPYYQGWINGNATDVLGAAATYAGEDNTTQLGINLSTLPSLSAIATDEITEAFDEPLTMQQVLTIVTPFISA